jgi:hypothetical protein
LSQGPETMTHDCLLCVGARLPGREPVRASALDPRSFWPRRCSDRPPSGDQLNDQDDHGDRQQNVNQAPGNVETESQNPQDKQNHENRPKHACVPQGR